MTKQASLIFKISLGVRAVWHKCSVVLKQASTQPAPAAPCELEAGVDGSVWSGRKSGGYSSTEYLCGPLHLMWQLTVTDAFLEPLTGAGTVFVALHIEFVSCLDDHLLQLFTSEASLVESVLSYV